MLDPGRALAEAIYFIQYVLAQLLWSLDRALLSMAVIAEDVNTWLTTNVAFLVDLLTNALAGPMGALFVFALTLLGVWYLLNSITPTKRVVDPQKLLLYGFMTFFFFSTPVMVIEMVEGLRPISRTMRIDSASGRLTYSNVGTPTNERCAPMP